MFKLKSRSEETKKKEGLHPNRIFWGIFLGSVAGCVPLLSAVQAVLLLILLVFRTNIVCAVLFFAAGKFLSLQHLAEMIDRLGLHILTGSEGMVEFSRWFTQLPVITYLNFTNSMVMGGFVLGIAGGLPAALIARQMALLFDRKARAKEKAEEEEMAKQRKNNAPAPAFNKTKQKKQPPPPFHTGE